MAQHIPDTGVGWGLIGVDTFLDTSGRDYPEILKYGAVFNTSVINSKGVTLLRTNDALKINNFGINFCLKS